MTTLSLVIDKLKRGADITPQYKSGSLPEIEQQLQELLDGHPQLRHYSDYLEFLRLTGGAHIKNKIFSLGIYGFSGMVVPSFQEVNLLDQGHFFLFGEVLYFELKAQFYFAFDLRTTADQVFEAGDDDAGYRLCSPSWIGFLQRFSDGDYPGMT